MKNNTPKRKRLNKSARLARAKDWIKSYNGKNLVKGYAKWFGLDTLSALAELKLSGVPFEPESDNKIIKAFYQRSATKQKRANGLKEVENIEADENFAFIIGYTANGFPYGLTHDEWHAENEDSPKDEYGE